MRIAIAITTRDRPETLKHSLAYFARFPVPESKLIIVSDSETPNPLSHYSSPRRMGIARAKNACISLALESDPDYIFLFDDDCHPIAEDWHLPFTQAHHTQLIIPHPGYEPAPLPNSPNINSFPNCMGAMLCFSRHAIETLGGYDSFPSPYGFEHAQISQRAYRAGLIPAPYICPANAHNLLYALDVSPRYTTHKIPHPANPSSCTLEEINRHHENLSRLIDPPICIERPAIYET